jgi:hypothetical protein
MTEARLRRRVGEEPGLDATRAEREAGALYVVVTGTSDQTDPPWTACDDIVILVTGPDESAAGAEIGARPAITPTAAAGALRTMRWPLFEFRVSRKESASGAPKLEGGSGPQAADERRTGRSKRPTSATTPASTKAESPMNTGRSSHQAAVVSC